MNVLHLASGNRWTGAAAVAFAEVEALRSAGIDAHFACVGGYRLQEKVGHLDWAHPVLERAQNPVSFARTVASIRRLIAAHAIESAKLLLMSRDASRHPAGVANSSGGVGRFLLTQLDAGLIGLSKEPVYPYRGPVSTAGILELRDRVRQGSLGDSTRARCTAEGSRLVRGEDVFELGQRHRRLTP